MPKKSLETVLDKSIILTITAPNDNAKLISVQCGGGASMLSWGKTSTKLFFSVLFVYFEMNEKSQEVT